LNANPTISLSEFNFVNYVTEKQIAKCTIWSYYSLLNGQNFC